MRYPRAALAKCCDPCRSCWRIYSIRFSFILSLQRRTQTLLETVLRTHRRAHVSVTKSRTPLTAGAGSHSQHHTPRLPSSSTPARRPPSLCHLGNAAARTRGDRRRRPRLPARARVRLQQIRPHQPSSQLRRHPPAPAPIVPASVPACPQLVLPVGPGAPAGRRRRQCREVFLPQQRQLPRCETLATGFY
jgi:hypothetical protein